MLHVCVALGLAAMMATKIYDVVVVGAGVFGAWSALHLARRGKRVLLVDAYGPGHSRSSSGEPDVSRMRLSRTHPSRSIVKATRAKPWSPRARASAG